MVRHGLGSDSPGASNGGADRMVSRGTLGPPPGIDPFAAGLFHVKPRPGPCRDYPARIVICFLRRCSVCCRSGTARSFPCPVHHFVPFPEREHMCPRSGCRLTVAVHRTASVSHETWRCFSRSCRSRNRSRAIRRNSRLGGSGRLPCGSLAGKAPRQVTLTPAASSTLRRRSSPPDSCGHAEVPFASDWCGRQTFSAAFRRPGSCQGSSRLLFHVKHPRSPS
jgi:hypothetical protein